MYSLSIRFRSHVVISGTSGSQNGFVFGKISGPYVPVRLVGSQLVRILTVTRDDLILRDYIPQVPQLGKKPKVNSIENYTQFIFPS